MRFISTEKVTKCTPSNFYFEKEKSAKSFIKVPRKIKTMYFLAFWLQIIQNRNKIKQTSAKFNVSYCILPYFFLLQRVMEN